ncbi:Dihydrodipicolinate synthase [Salmonella enterica subsp. enterica]|uniref:Dihydrodipicolinate synthase n=1 Tax=Salmonella enterica I TaxID=59201 RepID=A0A379V356_SALET|nr:Dihydrodipicolinate synthase [Salmonella enterica subsp. enterica]
MKMMVIADDFTGSNDTGVQLAKKGARTEVMLSASQKPSRRADVLVINTESRAMPADQAASAVYAALSPWCETSPAPLVYKKIDSTFRGNIGAEVTAAMRASQRKLAVIAAAIPAAGRTTLEGKCLVNGVPLLETEFASDPKTPIVSSRIAEIVALQSEIPVYEVFLQDVRRGGLSALLTAYAAEGEGIIVVDAVEERDLTLIAQAACEQPSMPLLVGAAGLVNALPVELFMQDRQRLPVLVVAGSMSEATRRQVDNALCRGRAEVVDIDAARMVSDRAEQEIASVVEQALRAVKSASTYDFTHQPSRRRSTVNRRAVRKIRDEPSAIGRATEPAAWRRHVKHYRAGADWRIVSDRRRYRYRRRRRAWR